MKRFLSLPIRIHMFLLVILLALPAAGVIINAGFDQRRQAYKEAAADSARLTYTISSEINILVRGTEQLADTLAQLPSVQHPDPKTISRLLGNLIAKYPQYSNIIVTDKTGLVLASALPMKQPVTVADRSIFTDARKSGRFSAGEYMLGKISRKPLINFGYPIKDSSGKFNGIIAIGIDLAKTKHLLEKSYFPKSAEYVLVDRNGIFLYRTFDLEKYLGTPLRKDLLKTMENGPDEATIEFVSNKGQNRVSSYRKLRLDDTQPPYMYVRSGFPVESVNANANRAIQKNLALLIPFFALSLGIAWFIGKRGIVDRVAALQNASHRLADGDFSVQVAKAVSGSELGDLATTFDNMARALAEREKSLIENVKLTVASETKFRTLFESMQEGVIICETIRNEVDGPVEFRCIDINPACENILRKQRDQIIGGKLLSIFSCIGENGASCFREVARTGIPKHFEEYHTDSNTYFEVHAICPDKDRLAIIFSDITQQKRMQDERIRNDKLESLGVLAGGIAHDFNNFLAGILGNVSFAKMLLDPSLKAHRLLGEAEKATRGAAQLARQLLTFARGGMPVKKVVSVKQVLCDSATLVLRGTNVKSIMEIPDTLKNVEADEGQLTQAFHNIIINAAQAMPTGGFLTISAENVSFTEYDAPPLNPGAYIKVTFVDEGRGIPPEDLERIFDPYFTTKPDGTGLGLASCYSIISRHDGHINVASTPGKGTTFELYLPACNKAIEDSQDNDERLVPGSQTRTGRILIMDDDELITNLLGEIFTDIGYAVTICRDGSEAIDFYRDAMEHGKSYDAVVMDLTIPGGMGGKEAAGKLLQIDPGARLVASSGYSNDPIMSDCRTYGFLAAIAKPYKAADVGKIIESILTMNRSQV